MDDSTVKQYWTDTDLGDYWTLTDHDYDLLKGKVKPARFAVALLLKYYQLYARFPDEIQDFPDCIVDYVSVQIGIPPDCLTDYIDDNRSARRHRMEILSHLNVIPFDGDAEQTLRHWLINQVLPDVPNPSYLDELITAWFLNNKIECPGDYRLDRLVKSAEREFEKNLFRTLYESIDQTTASQLDALIKESNDRSDYSWLCSDMGPVSLASVLQAIDKLEKLRQLGIPNDILKDIHPKLISRYRLRAATENAWEHRRHPPSIRYPLLIFYCVVRESEIIDTLVDLLIQVIHKISVRSERKVINELIRSITKVHGKNTILFHIAEAVTGNPDGTVREVIFPVAPEETMNNLVKEFRSSGPAYVNKIYTKIRSSYAHHYRRMLPRILDVLVFRSNNSNWRSMLDAITIIQNAQGDRRRYFSLDDIPIEDIISNKWQDIVIEHAPDGTRRINRINYEICVLQSLRNKLRCKEIWVERANRFCNPDDDTPADFEENRNAYYAALNWSVNPDIFIKQTKISLEQTLSQLNENLPSNNNVNIVCRGKKSTIRVAKLDRQADPPTLAAVKQELGNRWPATSLLDVLKETDYRVGFTKVFSSAASREAIAPDDLMCRQLLTLYGLGTNAGLKRLASGQNGISYKELLHIRRRFINKDSLREAIRRVVNATFRVRSPKIWGEATTTCASDSTQVGAWDQNLMTEWHVRYGGPGVMIYWHVDENATCIYSQLKRCSSSEVASMIEGVLHHCTDKEVKQQYVDSHGQSVVAFAFCHLLGFSLMPRFKGIDKIKLAQPQKGSRKHYPNIEPVFSSRPIKWKLIAQQYDELIKLTTALREFTAQPEAILRRFTRDNAQHPTYRALIELGRVIKTIFVCNYLMSEQLRQEINTGLNVIERWNGVNDFIYFGKAGELATNKTDDQEISILSLHLLQMSLVYINTLMIQQVLAESLWFERMTERDMAALTPLPHSHFNPYGQFELDMDQRLALDEQSINY